RGNAGARVGLHLIGPLMVAIGLGCGYFLIARLDLPPAAAIVPITLTLTGALLTALANVRGALPPRIPWLVIMAMIVTYAGLIVYEREGMSATSGRVLWTSYTPMTRFVVVAPAR